jgi:hypothetical protein
MSTVTGLSTLDAEKYAPRKPGARFGFRADTARSSGRYPRIMLFGQWLETVFPPCECGAAMLRGKHASDVLQVSMFLWWVS